MVWRIGIFVERGEIDCRKPGRVTGRIWLRGLEAPIRLDLVGTPENDLAGHTLRFENPRPELMPEDQRMFELAQRGRLAEVTAARKVKVPDRPIDLLEELGEDVSTAPFHWANGFYLEWYGSDNRRVVIASTDFKLEIDPEKSLPTERTRLPDALLDPAADDPDDRPQSVLEAEVAKEADEMDRLFERINTRLAQLTEMDAGIQDQIMREERNRLRKELGKIEIEPGSSLEDAEDLIWSEEEQARAEELFEADLCPVDEERRHPLVVRCQDLSLQLQADIEESEWVEGPATREHPLHEITNSLCYAAAKLAGALNLQDRWPPDPCNAATALPRLKKARRYLRETIIGIHIARSEKLAAPEWLDGTETDALRLHEAVSDLIAVARASIKSGYDPYL